MHLTVTIDRAKCPLLLVLFSFPLCPFFFSLHSTTLPHHFPHSFIMSAPAQDWTNEQLLSDAVSKKDIVTFLHLNATHDFLVEFKLTGKLATVVKNGMYREFALFQ